MSRFNRDFTADELTLLGANAAANNSNIGVTGVLLSIGDRFFQVIEGQADIIDSLFNKISLDERHKEVVCLRAENDATIRNFPDWSMRTINLDSESGEILHVLRVLLDNIGSAHSIVGHYTQPLVSRFMRRGINPLDIPARKTELVVLFGDMVGFTTMTNDREIQEVVQLVSVALDVCSETIARHDGELTKFLGDGVLAYWPIEHVDAALASAIDCLRQLTRIRSGASPGALESGLFMGFGVAAGEMIEGNIGSNTKTDFTVIGDAVNIASRVEQLTRSNGCALLMTAEVVERASINATFTSLGFQQLKGISRAREIFTIEDPLVRDFVPRRVAT